MAFFIPQTKPGCWSLASLACFFSLLLITNIISRIQGPRSDELPWNNLWIFIPMLLAGLSSMCSLGFGLFALIKSKERATIIFVTTLIGLFIFLFSIGELFISH